MFFVTPVHAQKIEPDTPSNVLKSTGAQFGEGWNYFQVNTDKCNIHQIVNEIQADGGSALNTKDIWLKKLDIWESHQSSDTTKVELSDTLAFLSNQKFFFDLDPNVCINTNTNRQDEIEKLRGNTGNKSWLDKILGVFTTDYWQPVASESSKLTTRYSLFTPDLTVSGKFKVGLLSFDDLEASIQSLTNLITFKSGLSVKNDSIGTVNIPAGQTSVVVDSSYAKPESKIFVTPSEPVAISAISSESGKILIKIASSLSSDLKVNWWVIN